MDRFPINNCSARRCITREWVAFTCYQWERNRTSMHRKAKNIAVNPPHRRVRRVTKFGSILSDRIEHRLEFAGRARDRAHDVARGGLFLAGLISLAL